MNNSPFAILDLGTNTFHLLIVQKDTDRGWKRVFHRRITVKLGQGGIHKNEIAPAPFKRGLRALKQFRSYMDRYGVKQVRAFGTAALRNATNGRIFIREAKKLYRIPIKLISGDDEAGMILKGVQQAVDISSEKFLIMDIGGGSVEFIIANNKELFFKKSFKLGAALLLESFQPEDPIKKATLLAIQKHLELALESLFDAISLNKPISLIGSAGSFESFASMIRHLYPESGSHYRKKSHIIRLNHFNQLYSRLIFSTRSKRKQMRGLTSMRVDMIVMAAVLLKVVLQKSGIRKLYLSTYSLKEGAAAELFGNSKHK
ncbi:MAG TPA: exopolyphosphatase [Bacteroidia bacterium]|nr:exopolyphosphatase [Bacteroidia bacterium]